MRRALLLAAQLALEARGGSPLVDDAPPRVLTFDTGPSLADLVAVQAVESLTYAQEGDGAPPDARSGLVYGPVRSRGKGKVRARYSKR